MRYLRYLIPLLALSALVLPSIASAKTSSTHPPKTKLIFSIDQGFGNGVVVNDDQTAVKRIADTIKPLTKRYDVYVLLNPMVADKQKLAHVLDCLKKKGIPFIFDIQTSDGPNLGSTTDFNKPYDVGHGVTISMDQLRQYKKRYGKMLAGLRFMEVFGWDFSVRVSRMPNPPAWAKWYTDNYRMPNDDAFQPHIAEEFIAFAEGNKMFMEWTDFHWFAFSPWDPPQQKKEEELAAVMSRHPDIVTVCYSNNEPSELSVPRINNWDDSVRKFVQHGAAGIGLSDQTWMRADFDNCPVEDIINWARSAQSKGARMIQFEPSWYLFKLPSAAEGATKIADYTKNPKWADRGNPTANFSKLADYLMQAGAEEKANNGRETVCH